VTVIRSPIQFLSYHESLKEPVQKALACPQVLQLLQLIERKIHIEVTDRIKGDAEWFWEKSIICLSPKLLQRAQANWIGAIVFELCNAFYTSEFQRVINSTQDTEKLVRSIEWIEHRSALLTHSMMLQIVSQDVEHDFDFIIPDFEVHYALNQISGHSEAIAEQHSSKANYRGTLYYPLAELDKNARLIIKHLIRSKTLGTCLKLGSKNLHFKEAVSVLHDYAGHSESFKKAVCCIEHLFPKTF